MRSAGMPAAVDDLAGTQDKIRIYTGGDGCVIKGIQMLRRRVSLAERNQHREMARGMRAQNLQDRPGSLIILKNVGRSKDIERGRQGGG